MHFHLHWIKRRKSKLLTLSGMTLWIAGLPQQLMKSSLIPLMNLVLLMKFHLILVTGTIIQMVMVRVTTTASHGTRKVTISLGKIETTNGKTKIISHGKIRIKSHGKTIKAKVINLVDTCFTLSQDQKFFVPADCDENVFQIICTLVKAQIDKAKQSGSNGKEINEISKDTLVNLLNISGETYDAAQSAVQGGEKSRNFIFFVFHQLTKPRI